MNTILTVFVIDDSVSAIAGRPSPTIEYGNNVDRYSTHAIY
jgi:hypothetical protein